MTPTPTDVLLGLVLDASGSMTHLRAATVEGIDALLTEQRALEDGRCLLSMTIFDTAFQTPVIASDVREVSGVGNLYQCGGGTALYDAVAITIQGIDGWLRNHPEFRGKVAIAVWTDGEENSSVRTTLPELNALIAARQAVGWEFMFLGTGGGGWTEGRKFESTIARNSNVAVHANAMDVGNSYAAVSRSVSGLRSTANYTPVEDTLSEVRAENDPAAIIESLSGSVD